MILHELTPAMEHQNDLDDIVANETDREPVEHVCGCGEAYSLREFRELAHVGTQTIGGITLEMRNCPCGSTRSIEVGP